MNINIISGFNPCNEELSRIEKELFPKNPLGKNFDNILTFIEKNQQLLVENMETAKTLCSIGYRVMKHSPDHPVIQKIRSIIQMQTFKESSVSETCEQNILRKLDFLRKNCGDIRGYVKSLKYWSQFMGITFSQKAQKKLLEFALEFSSHHRFDTMENLLNFGITDLNMICKIAEQCVVRTWDDEIMKNFGPDHAINDEKIRVAIIKAWTVHRSYQVSCYIKTFAVKDEKDRIEIAKMTIKEQPGCHARDYRNFEITDRGAILEIAKMFARIFPNSICYAIGLFYIDDENERIEIAKLCAQKKDSYLPQHIGKFEISNEQALVEIAKIYAVQDGSYLAENLDNFNIKDPEAILAVARLCCERGWKTLAFIDKFRITDQKVIIELAKTNLKNHPYGLSTYFRNLKIKNERDRIELALLSAKENGEYTAKHIENFEISDQQALIEIATLCAHENPGQTAHHFDYFKIKDPKARYTIARYCMEHNCANFIRNFDIPDEQDRIELARISAQSNAEKTSIYLEDFKITDQAVLVELARTCIENSKGVAARNIIFFKIESKKILLELAYRAAELNGSATACAIEDFKVVYEKDRIEIAKLCSSNEYHTVAYHIGKFNISDEKALIEIAKLCAKQSGGDTAQQIRKFMIIDAQAHYEIALLCAENSAEMLENLDEFRIKDEEQLYEIAIRCAENDPQKTIKFIPQFGFQNESKIVAIARVCAAQVPFETAGRIPLLGLKNPENLYHLFLDCILQNEGALYWIDRLPSVEKLKNFNNIYKVIRSREAHVNRVLDLFTKEVGLLACSVENKKKLMTLLHKMAQQDLFVQYATREWFLRSLMLSKRMSADDLNWLLDKNFWDELFHLHDPILRTELTSSLFSIEGFAEVITICKGKYGFSLLSFPFTQMKKLGLDQKRLRELSDKLHQLFKSPTEVRLLIHSILVISNSKILKAHHRVRGFNKVFFDPVEHNLYGKQTILKNLNAAKGLLDLKNSDWVESEKELPELFQECFEKIIPVGQIDGDFAALFESKFGSSRNSNAIITYAADLKTLNDPLVLPCLGRYVRTVFDGTFKSSRYETKDNKHLETVFLHDEQLMKKWSDDDELSLDEIVVDDDDEPDFNPREWIQRVLISDHHLGDVKLPYLERYYGGEVIAVELKNDLQKAMKQAEINLVLKKLQEAPENKECLSELKRLKKEAQDTKKNTQVSLLLLQEACIALAEALPKNYIKLLEKIHGILVRIANQPTGFKNSEFQTNVKEMMDLMKTQQKKLAETDVKVVMTDDPIDLLLCGTDIFGSCQRIGGSPALNKGLLGYLIDGKNRLLAIKDSSGRIVTRCLLRLLWDGEKPVLYRDRMYPGYPERWRQNALNALARKIANKLNVPLTSSDKGKPYGKDLFALGGPAPYEYCDGSGGVQKNGEFTISGANLL
jgi:hypothetical protein